MSNNKLGIRQYLYCVKRNSVIQTFWLAYIVLDDGFNCNNFFLSLKIIFGSYDLCTTSALSNIFNNIFFTDRTMHKHM